MNSLTPGPSEANIGQRVSIRLFDENGGFRDLLGYLEEAHAVRKKDGSLITFDPNQIFLWKVVPTP